MFHISGRGNILERTGALAKKQFPKWKLGKGKKKKKTNAKRIAYYRKKKSRSKKNRGKFSLRKSLEIFGIILLLSLMVTTLVHAIGWSPFSEKKADRTSRETTADEQYQILSAESGPCGRPEIIRDYIVENPYSRSGIVLNDVRGLVVHYVSNPGSTAEENRNYFENLKDTHLTKASSHFIIGLDGEIIQCIPLDEISYASNDRNGDTVSIECCHPRKDGKFNRKTYRSLVRLTAWLCDTYGLSETDVIRHYDVTGKMCPKYYVKHEDAWQGFLSDIAEKLEKNG